jgi:anaerobic ribonucleoside-triphosphate reductase
MTNFSNQDPCNASDYPQLRDDERQPCEVWTRVMGYHRPVLSFNVGKQGEHRERQFFAEQRCTLGT